MERHACALLLTLMSVVHAANAGPCSEAASANGALRNAISRLRVEATVVALAEELTLSANTTAIESSGDAVLVRFCCVSDPQENDFVAVYVPADAQPNATAPVKMKPASEANYYMRFGAGSLRCEGRGLEACRANTLRLTNSAIRHRKKGGTYLSRDNALSQ